MVWGGVETLVDPFANELYLGGAKHLLSGWVCCCASKEKEKKREEKQTLNLSLPILVMEGGKSQEGAHYPKH